ncbi:uncharacterized protein LOC113855537 [Abrus precatorius]|uniref:Uncharacterized protein LOC113855537 n=1 Tax=Abrus precatorius TaxID=3816 RepID=A0A8B8KIA9_ABRPR|nr:uncharacterized protein LOC113855537 [Abrus precatorius]
MLLYAKFMKDLFSKKKKLKEDATIALTKECNAILQQKLPLKLKDLSSFTIPCIIGNMTIGKALCDLGANINLMPLSVLKKLGFGEVKNIGEDSKVPVILGRPFLTTGRALIDVQQGQLMLRVHDEKVTFKVFEAMQHPDDKDTCCKVDMLDSLVAAKGLMQENYADPLKKDLVNTIMNNDEESDEELQEIVQ